jgi:DNA-binding NarL/FixJ family response regulator
MTRVLLIGTPAERARIRARLGASADIVGEFTTIAEARRAGLEVDALLVAPSYDDRRGTAPGVDALDDPAGEPLTPREIDVLELLAEGLPNKAIAARLGISDQTVKFHVASLSGKLGAGNRTDAVRRAVRRGLIAL